MCCLFGMIDCKGSFGGKAKARILSVLASECEERGTDATGIAYCSHGKLRIYKRPKEAHTLRFRIPHDSRVIMGHTRMTTQGAASKNRNNHPFFGHLPNDTFALAHNGVLYNDHLLRKSKKLPHSNIETDSYIAVQLIEEKRSLDFSSLKYMAEQVEGSFVFTLLDQDENLYFVKGDNPLCIYYYPERDFYIYASTEAILVRALARLGIRLGRHEKLTLDCGDMLMLSPDGGRKQSEFSAANFFHPWEYTPWRTKTARKSALAENSYLEDLKAVACYYGYAPGAIDRMVDHGFTLDEIEELLYEGGCYF